MALESLGNDDYSSSGLQKPMQGRNFPAARLSSIEPGGHGSTQGSNGHSLERKLDTNLRRTARNGHLIMQQTSTKRAFGHAYNQGSNMKTPMKDGKLPASKYQLRQNVALAGQLELMANSKSGKNAELLALKRQQFNNSAMMV